jgi:hypothetical protein
LIQLIEQLANFDNLACFSGISNTLVLSKIMELKHASGGQLQGLISHHCQTGLQTTENLILGMWQGIWTVGGDKNWENSDVTVEGSSKRHIRDEFCQYSGNFCSKYMQILPVKNICEFGQTIQFIFLIGGFLLFVYMGILPRYSSCAYLFLLNNQ